MRTATDRFFDTLLPGLAGILTGVMTVVVFLQVLGRYVFQYPLPWSEELARYLFIWSSLLGAAIALHRGAHISLGLLRPAGQGAILHQQCLDLGLAVFLTFLLVEGFRLTLLTTGQPSPALQVPMALIYAAVPTSAALMLVALFRRLFTGGGHGGGRGAAPVAVILFAGFLALIVLNLPIAFSLGVASLTAILVKGELPLAVIPQRIIVGLDVFALLAVPLFILAGCLMDTGGISRRLIRFADALVGRIRGGLGMVAVLATLFFSGISGSSSADTAAIGATLIPQMIKRGYPPEKATAIVASAGATGILIPPCMTMVIYGILAETSIAVLFMAGVLPGLLLGLVMMVLTAFLAPLPPSLSLSGSVWREIRGSVMEASLALLLPAIIMGGILTGVFTATEAAVVAVVYGCAVALGYYRDLRLSDLPGILVRTAVTSGVVMILTGMASSFAWILARERIPQTIAGWIVRVSDSPWVFLLLVNILFLLVGMVIDGIPALIVLVPILVPIAKALQIDLIHLGIILVLNLGIGTVTPPVGVCLFVASSISGVPVIKTVRPLLPYVGVMILVLLVMTYLPGVTLFLPRVLMGYR
ncbi:MAG: TRAP transporter large permease subunit [candidate division NC10 bacterium]|nr:TRAP transporter large permease subunit [candidate division NC10 bacterium]